MHVRLHRSKITGTELANKPVVQIIKDTAPNSGVADRSDLGAVNSLLLGGPERRMDCDTFHP